MKYKAIFDDTDVLEDESKELKPWQRNVIVFAIIAVVLNLLAIIYVSSCRSIYFWSSADYWSMARKIANGELGTNVWSTVYHSIINDEFNYLPSMLPALFVKLFGESRMVFILSLVNCYLLPADIIIYLLARRLGKAPLITTLIVLFTMPLMLYLTLNGFTEMGGFTLSLMAFYLYFRKNNKSLSVWHYIAIGIVLTVLMLWNNWFLFFSVSFITAMVTDAILFRKRPYMCLITLAVVIAIMALGFEGFMFKRLVLAYSVGSFNFEFALNIKLITRYIGLIFIILMAVCSVSIIRKKDNRPVFMWIQMFVCYITFTATRTHGQGHLLMYAPAFIMLLILTVKHITTEKLLLGIVSLSIIHSVSVIIPRSQPNNINEIKYTALVPSFSIKPAVRDSAYDILALKSKLDNRIPYGKYLGVLAYSDIINSEILKNAEPSLNIKQYRSDYIANTIPYFDLPDTNLAPLCNASYMLVALPAQYVRDDQKVLLSAVNSFENWTDIACAYKELYEYETVIDGVTLKLFERTRDVTQQELAQFTNKLRNMN